MDEARRDALKTRRAALRDRLALAPINALMERLAANGCRPEILFPNECRAALGELIDAPCRDERIDWSRIVTGHCRSWSSDAERDRLALEAVRACASPGAILAIVWNPTNPGLALPSEEIERAIGILLESATETWIVDRNGSGWLVECAIFGPEICWSLNLMQGIGQSV